MLLLLLLILYFYYYSYYCYYYFFIFFIFITIIIIIIIIIILLLLLLLLFFIIFVVVVIICLLFEFQKEHTGGLVASKPASFFSSPSLPKDPLSLIDPLLLARQPKLRNDLINMTKSHDSAVAIKELQGKSQILAKFPKGFVDAAFSIEAKSNHGVTKDGVEKDDGGANGGDRDGGVKKGESKDGGFYGDGGTYGDNKQLDVALLFEMLLK